MFRLLALSAGITMLASCGCGYPLEGYDATDWSMDGDGAALVTDEAGNEVVWTGLGEGSLCGFEVTSGVGMQDTYFDDTVPTHVFDAEAGSVLVSTGGLSLVDGGTGEVTPVQPGHTAQLVDARLRDGGLVVLYDDCTVEVHGELSKLPSSHCDGRILEGDTVVVLQDGVLYPHVEGGFVEGPKVTDAAWSEPLGAWLLGHDGVISVVLDGEILSKFDAPGLTDVFALGEYIGFRDADGYVHRIDVDGITQAGPWIGSTGQILDTNRPDRIVLERNGVHVKVWVPEA